MLSLVGNPWFGEKKDQPPPKKSNKEIKLNKEVKEKECTKLESLQRIVKQLMNEVIGLNKIMGEG